MKTPAMDKGTRKALEAAGWWVGDTKEFLGLTDEEERLVELRVKIAKELRRLREAQHMTQGQLAARVGSSQSRIAKAEAGSPEVSLDMLFRNLFALGGSLDNLTGRRRSIRRPTRAQTAPKPTAPRKRSVKVIA
jgi:DNA-binding XRE family transcriptional regulator